MRLHLGTRKGYLVFRRHGRGDWRIERTAFLGDPVSQLLPDSRDGRLYAALNLGHFGVKLRVSEDEGRSFRELTAPAYPRAEPAAASDNGAEAPAAGGEGKDAPSVDLLWCVEPAGPEPGSLFIGTIPGGLFRSDDGGESWALNEALWNEPSRERWFGGGYPHPGIHSVLVEPGGRRIVAGISCGGVWTSEDGGGSWRATTEGMFAVYVPDEQRGDPAIQDPHRLAWCAGDRRRIWCQHHNGFFRSDDGGATWASLEVPPSSFGFAVAAHPGDPDLAWSAPLVKDECRVPVDGRMVVARTRDGGASWEGVGRGLPEKDSFAVVYRHGLECHPEEAVLALATTTGALWISEDLGDSWDLVSADLAPIYCVRFGSDT